MRKFLMAVAVAVAAGAPLALSIPAAQAGTGGQPPPAGVASARPASNTPRLPARSSPRNQIRQLVQCGGTMYAVGTFSSIKRRSITYSRTDIVSFSASSPYRVTSWAPRVVGSTKTDQDGAAAVNSIAFAGGNCANAYIGGNFIRVNGTSVRNIAEISTRTGNVNTGFAHSANGRVDTLAAVRGHLLVGGTFTSVNGAKPARMASLSPSTGRGDGFLNLSIAGSQVYNQQLSHGGTFDLVEGVFSSAGGVPRHQIFMLNVGGSRASVTAWTSGDFNVACTESFWARAAAWSPDDSTVYVATTGFHVVGGSSQGARSGPCDAALAYPATHAPVGHKWINYTGCDSLYSVAADSHAAYFGGHERYAMNPNACNTLGTGGYNAPGMEGVSPANGALYTNSGGSAGFYSRARGLGADDMLVTRAGLWVASDNLGGSETCGGVSGHSGICFLPYR
ncbi:MAG: domain containing protein [Actinomycetia bacterium]|nr:domain containing protein [Actinomycetes bacterium]